MTAVAPRLFALNLTEHPDNGSQVGVIAKRTYRVVGARCVVADEQIALVEQPQVAADKSALIHDVDTALNRRFADVLVLGKARPPSANQRTFDARVRVGALDRHLRVFGDRRCWRDKASNLRFTEPHAVETIDVGWGAAYGGVDRVALRKYGDPIERFHKEQDQAYDPQFGSFAYPRNRAGRGFLIEPTSEALDACALPNLEDPAYSLVPERLAIGRPDRWPAGPMVAGLGWLSYNYFPRMAMAGLVPPFEVAAFPAASFFEVRMGALNPKCLAARIALAQRFDIGIAQQAAVGMRTTSIEPVARIDLTNLHPRRPSWSFTLPEERPLFAVQMPDGPGLSLEAKIRTVVLEPELDRVCVVWVGEHREPAPVGPGKAAKIRFAAKWAR